MAHSRLSEPSTYAKYGYSQLQDLKHLWPLNHCPPHPPVMPMACATLIVTAADLAITAVPTSCPPPTVTPAAPAAPDGPAADSAEGGPAMEGVGR